MQKRKLQPKLTWFNLSSVINLTSCEAVRLQDITMAQLYRSVAMILQHKHHCILRFARLNVNGRLDVSAFGNRGIFHAYLYTELVLLQLITAQRLTLTKYKQLLNQLNSYKRFQLAPGQHMNNNSKKKTEKIKQNYSKELPLSRHIKIK